jgi:DMSO reductase family type II enzyme heme b subunit
VGLPGGEAARSAPEKLALWLASLDQAEAQEGRDTADELARWLAALGRNAGSIADPFEMGVGESALACGLASEGVPEACACRVHRGWTTRLLDSFRWHPFVPLWVVALLPILGGANCAGPVEPSARPGVVSGGDIDAVEGVAHTAARVAVQDEAGGPSDAGARLYDRLCASCHGTTGDGAGPAARFVYPKPRNFRQEQFRMVSTTNLVPSDEDLMRTLERGMPGSSMFSFGHLSLDERKSLVAHVRGLVRQGLEERFKREAQEFGEEPDLEAMAELVKERTTPGANVELPAEWPAEDAASIARGRDLYVKATCASCHGETGKGDGVQVQQDELGMPIRPRDYTRGVFKGGREREPLYARIALGVPGTPMPSTPALKPEDIADLVHYIRSLSDPATEAQVFHKRTTIRVAKAARPLGEAISEADWEGVAAIPIVVSPLWWRDDADASLRVQALHDGAEVAVRLSWKDSTSNGGAIRSDEFPDMAAVQLFRGRDEPFLGMGAKGAPVEVWLWNAAAQADLEQYADVDTTYPNMSVDAYPFEAGGDGPRPHATDRQPKDFLTAFAVGNQRSDPTRPLAGSGLTAEGQGSATMRPPVAQDVKARGVWKDGLWTVVLRRPMETPAEGRVSIAFALWDGSARDRNGQKLVSIWHDLVWP